MVKKQIEGVERNTAQLIRVDMEFCWKLVFSFYTVKDFIYTLWKQLKEHTTQNPMQQKEYLRKIDGLKEDVVYLMEEC